MKGTVQCVLCEVGESGFKFRKLLMLEKTLHSFLACWPSPLDGSPLVIKPEWTPHLEP